MSNVIYGKCGIIMACLTDPLSQLISKVIGINGDDINSIGFYYEVISSSSTKHNVILFNTYDNDPVSWIKLGINMESFMTSPFVRKIIFHPIVIDRFRDSQRSILTRNNITNKTHNTKIDETFRALVIEIISKNSHMIHDKNLSYTNILMKMIGGDDVKSMVTGYNLVNIVLSNLMRTKLDESEKLSSEIIPCNLLHKSITISSLPTQITTNDINYVIEESRKEIARFIAVFVDLFIYHSDFRKKILEFRTNNTNLDGLFNREDELISMIISGLQTGMISNQNINEIIYELNNERISLGHFKKLPLSINPAKELTVINDEIPCTFQQPVVLNDTNGLRDLGIYISHIVDNFDNQDTIKIDLSALISHYNQAIIGTNLPKIIPSSKSNYTLSKHLVATLVGDKSDGNIEIPIGSQHVPISIYGSNLNKVSESQLHDILIYIDSLNISDSKDNKFANLQNEIIHELGRRRNTTNK